MKYVALGSAEVEADSAEVAREAVAFEEMNWQLRLLCTAQEWKLVQTQGARPWVGKASYIGLPFITWTFITGRVGPWEVFHPFVRLGALFGLDIPL